MVDSLNKKVKDLRAALLAQNISTVNLTEVMMLQAQAARNYVRRPWGILNS